jgi:uncharacterized protein (DUF2141 family)
MLNKKRSFLPYLRPLFLALLALSGCAVQQRPQGGPRDLLPPKLLKAIPADQTRNFTGKKIVLEFDEYFKLVNQYQEITISPAQERNPEFTQKQKSLIIELKDSLQKNTTYVISFGKAIADVNEGNAVKNLTYVFATGPSIDSLTISGTVTDALTQKKEKEVSVLLFNIKQDSILFGKKKPTLFTTTDSAGNFKFSNLKADSYKVYALKEASADKIYNNDNELIAFKANPIQLKKDTSGINLTLFKETPQNLRFTNRAFDRDGSMFLVANRPLIRPSVRIIFPEGLDAQKLVEINKTADSINVYSKNMDFDSVKIATYENGVGFDTVTLRKGRRETFTRNLALNYNISQSGVIKPGSDLMVASNMPIESFDQSLITLMEDSAKVNYTMRRDTSTRKKLIFKYAWKPKAKYNLVFNENSITGFFGDKIKKTQKTFSLDNPENYGEQTMRIAVPDTSKSYVVELLTATNDQKTVVRTNRISRNSAIEYKMLLAGKYQIRITYDTNKNGKWDSGSIAKKTQPEYIWVNQTIYTVRPNWSDTADITVPPEPVIAP